MKKSLKVLSLVLVLVMAVLTLASCSQYNALKSAFEKNGYEENTDLEDTTKAIKEELEKDDLAVTLHLMTKKKSLASALIIEFKSTEDMKKAFDDSETIKGIMKDISKNDDVKEFVKTLEESGYVKGNCLVLPLPLAKPDDIKKIVKNA